MFRVSQLLPSLHNLTKPLVTPQSSRPSSTTPPHNLSSQTAELSKKPSLTQWINGRPLVPKTSPNGSPRFVQDLPHVKSVLPSDITSTLTRDGVAWVPECMASILYHHPDRAFFLNGFRQLPIDKHNDGLNRRRAVLKFVFDPEVEQGTLFYKPRINVVLKSPDLPEDRSESISIPSVRPTDWPIIQAIVQQACHHFPIAPDHYFSGGVVDQFRITNDGDITRIVNTIHQDNTEFFMVLLVQKSGIKAGADTILYAPQQNGTLSATSRVALTDPGDCVFVDDRRFFHYVTDMLAKNPHDPAYRDVILVSVRTAPRPMTVPVSLPNHMYSLSGFGYFYTMSPPHKQNVPIDQLIPTEDLTGSEDYVTAMAQHPGDTLPPISVVLHEGRLFIVDGHRRYRAALERKDTSIMADVIASEHVETSPHYIGRPLTAILSTNAPSGECHKSHT